jgi:xanthine dehydrogenase accessory factor
VCAPFAQSAERINVTPDDEIVIMTRGHANDLDILTWALRTPAYYIGLIGSRSKIAHTKAMLLAQGFTEADFARVHTPIGLPIEAETPMEIAVSVAAEMILCRAEQAKRNEPEA